MSSTCPHNMVNFGLLTPEIHPVVWGTPQISTGFASWQRYCTASTSGRQPNFATLNRGRHLCSAGRPSRWALAHILVALIRHWNSIIFLGLSGTLIYIFKELRVHCRCKYINILTSGQTTNFNEVSDA